MAFKRITSGEYNLICGARVQGSNIPLQTRINNFIQVKHAYELYSYAPRFGNGDFHNLITNLIKRDSDRLQKYLYDPFIDHEAYGSSSWRRIFDHCFFFKGSINTLYLTSAPYLYKEDIYECFECLKEKSLYGKLLKLDIIGTEETGFKFIPNGFTQIMLYATTKTADDFRLEILRRNGLYEKS